MKKIILALGTMLSLSNMVFAQTSMEEAQKYISVFSGTQNVDKKVLSKPDPQFMPYLALKFRTATSTDNIPGRKTGAADDYAVLTEVDSSCFQEITNVFYEHLVSKMQTVGVSYLEIEKIKSSKQYPKFTEELEPRHFNHNKYGTADVFTPYNIPFFKYPTALTKPMKWQSEMDAALSSLRLTIEFVELDISEQEVSKVPIYSGVEITTEIRSSAIPVIKITCAFQEGTAEQTLTGSYLNAAGFVMSNKKMVSTTLTNNVIYAPLNCTIARLDNSRPDFASKNGRFFNGGVQMGTYIVNVNPEEYKKATLEALDKYLDYITTVIKSYQN